MSGMKKDKVGYIEILRTIATVAVVFLHINMTLPANYTKYELGIENYAFFESCYMVVSWAVPIFFMISGYLLLNPERKMDLSKVVLYIKRMMVVLIMFGTVYAFMELIFQEKTVSFSMIVKSFFYVLEGKSWEHLWYLYTLIGLYIITIPLRAVVFKLSEREYEVLVIVLFIGTFLIPTINGYLGISIKNFMLIDNSVVYYLIGYYLATTKRNFARVCRVVFPLSIIFSIVTNVLGVYYYDSFVKTNMLSNSFFRALAAISLFVLIKSSFSEPDMGHFKFKLIRLSVKLKAFSFGVYLIHPFFINMIFKVLNVTPLSGPVVLMSVILWGGVYALSLCGAWILSKLPIINRYI